MLYPLRLITLNLNSWCSLSKTYSYTERIKEIARSISKYKPEVICMQELLSGKINDVRKEFVDYEIYAPMGNYGKKTLIACTLISRSFSSSVTIIDPINSKLPNRINVLKISPNNKNLMPFIVINLYAVSRYGNSNSHYDRVALNNDVWNTVYGIIIDNISEPICLLGDLQESSSEENCKKLKDVYKFWEHAAGLPTCSNTRLNEQNIDHVFYNPIAKMWYGPKTFTVDNSLLSKNISDHVCLITNASIESE